MQLDVREIQKIIPHRFPFILIDKVIELKPNEKLIAIKNVSINEHFFVGHFPEEKVMPGVLIVEAMAQAASVYFYYSQGLYGKNYIFYLAKVASKFLIPVRPGDQLKIEVTTKKLLKNTGFLDVKVIVDDKLVAEAELGLSAQPA